MTFPLIVIGLILRLAIHGQEAHTAGDICLWVGGIGVVLTVAWFVVVAAIGVKAVGR